MNRRSRDTCPVATFVLSRRGLWGAILLMWVNLGCASEELPGDDLAGTWMATSPSHQGRFIEISSEHIAFASDENHSTFFSIDRVESEEVDGKTLYTIAYHGTGDVEREIALRLLDSDPAAIELGNQAGTWVRKSGDNPKKKGSIR
jgi:hypothetical protein